MATILLVIAIVNMLIIVGLVRSIVSARAKIKALRTERDSRYTHEEASQYILDAYHQAVTDCAELYKRRQRLSGVDGYIVTLRAIYKRATVNGVVFAEVVKPTVDEDDTQPAPPVEYDPYYEGYDYTH